jgi:AcrR family transcriptional regulator
MDAALVVAKALRQPTQARAQRTRQALLDAATREFSERGYAATTSKSIATRAKVATGSFYQYFSNKDLVLLELARLRVAHLEQAAFGLLPSPESSEALDREALLPALRAIVDLVVHQHRSDPGLHAVLSERRHADAELDELTTAFEARLIERAGAWLALWQSPGDHKATAFILFGMLEGSIHSHVLGHPQVSDERFTRTLVESLVRVARPDLYQPQVALA